jgi:hypothetical protein
MNDGHWLDEPDNVKLLWRLFLAVLVACVLAGLVVTLHPEFGIESLFGFYAWFGFASSVAMALVAKGLALFLRRPDTYYDATDD